MNPPKLSRRGLLGALLAALTAWLCPRPQRTTPATRRPASLTRLPISKYPGCIAYAYDGSGRLVSVTHHPPQASQLIPYTHYYIEPDGTCTTYSYG